MTRSYCVIFFFLSSIIATETGCFFIMFLILIVNKNYLGFPI